MFCAHHNFAAMRVEGGEKRKSAELPKAQAPARQFAFLFDAARRYRKIERFEFDFGDSGQSLEFPRFKWAGGNPKDRCRGRSRSQSRRLQRRRRLSHRLDRANANSHLPLAL
jgi:hypothetical protein